MAFHLDETRPEVIGAVLNAEGGLIVLRSHSTPQPFEVARPFVMATASHGTKYSRQFLHPRPTG